MARFARIYPALFFWLLFDLPHFLYAERHFAHATSASIGEGLLVSFSALEGWFPHLAVLDPPSWSITVEFFFYLLFPLVALLLWRMRPWVLWVVSSILYLEGNLAIVWLMSPKGDNVWLDYNPISHVPEFLIGIALARLACAVADRPKWASLNRRWAPAVALLGAALFLAFSSGNPLIEKFFGATWFVVLGEASFALYLLHGSVGSLMRSVIHRHQVVGTLLYFSVAVSLSVASFYWLETPARKWVIAKFHAPSRESITTQALAQ